ncbi:MAG: hypothetical protein ACI8PT_001074 [Gammaproteobacteria bacterium]
MVNTVSDLTTALPEQYVGASAWSGRELRDSDAWMYHFSAADIAELEAALHSSLAQKTPLVELDQESFPLPNLGERLRALRDEVVTGRGFSLLRGLPVERLGIEHSARIYLGLGAYVGRPVSQNAKGHLLGHVTDLNLDVDDPQVRTYQTTARQYYHADSCDIVCLLCLKTAKEGGLSSIVSSVALYNEVMRQRPDLAAVLSAPIAIDRRGEVPAGHKPYFMLGVFNHFEGYVSTYYSRRYAESAQRFDDAPRLTPAHLEGFDLLDTLVEDADMHLNMALRPGDIQLVHNHTILHDRTAFVDWPEPQRRRHLLRLWLCPPNGRPLAPRYAQRWGSIVVGDRGGIRVPGASLRAPLSPE